MKRHVKFWSLLSILLVAALWSVVGGETVRTFVTTDSAALGQTVDIAIKSYALAGLHPAGTAGRLARVTDNDEGIYLDSGTRWKNVGGGKWKTFTDELTDLTKDAVRITGKVHSLPAGPASIEIISEQVNRGTVVWLRPNGTMAADTDTAFIVQVQGSPFVGADHSYLELGYNEGAPGHFLIGNLTEGAGTPRNLRFSAGESRRVFEIAQISGDTWRVDQYRNWFAADLNDPTGPASDQGTVRLSRTRRATAVQTGFTWSLQFSPFAFDGAGQVQRDIGIQGIGAIGTDANASYYLELTNNAGTPFLRLVPLVNDTGFATLWIDPPDETIPSSVTNPIPGINLNSTTYTLAGNLNQFSHAAFLRATLTAGVARTVTDSVSVYIEGPPIPAGSVTQTRSYALWVDDGYVRLDSLTQTTVGAAGGASALPATPTGYLRIFIGATERVIPFYDQN